MHKFFYPIFFLLISLVSCSKNNSEIDDSAETLHIRVISPIQEDKIIIDKGKVTIVEFEVSGFNTQISNRSYPKEGVLVNFTAPGELNPSSATTDAEGKVMVEWTPSVIGDTVTLKATTEKNGTSYLGTFRAKVQETPNPTNGKCVDLGLSVRWAGWNLGASQPHEYGDIYAWGETEKFNGSYKFMIDGLNYSYIGDNISSTDSDAAFKNWGKEWRLPTANEVIELFENCEWRWCVYNKKNGILFTGPNKNSIFIPAPGIAKISNPIWANIWPEGTLGAYWTGTYRNYSDDDGRYAYTISIRNDENAGLSSRNRAEGINIRPVSDYE